MSLVVANAIMLGEMVSIYLNGNGTGKSGIHNVALSLQQF